jgi:outer membrane protein assembly factor BamB
MCAHGLQRLNIALLLGILAATPLRAADWPQWRGQARDGSIPGFAAPAQWPKQLKRLWRVEVGEGHASPLVVGDRVFQFSRQDDQEVVRALKLSDGAVLWQQRYAAPYEMNTYARPHGKGPKSTPVVADGKAATLGISGILSVWNAASGEKLWQKEFSKQFAATAPLYGHALSPLVDQGRLVAHVGGHNSGALTAFDLSNGKVVWQQAIGGPGYTSPIVVSGSPRQLLTQSQNSCLAVAADDGRVLWSIPFTTDYDQNIVTPVVVDGRVIFSGIGKGIAAYRLGGGTPQEIWRNDELSMYMSSPVVVGKRLYGLANAKKGTFFCLDALTGKTIWTSDGRQGDNALLTTAGDLILALTTGGELIVYRAGGARFDVVARYKVAESPTWAHPAVAGNKILIKDAQSLTLWAVE